MSPEDSTPCRPSIAVFQQMWLTIGRKNWLFVGIEDGGQASATFLSLSKPAPTLESNLITPHGCQFGVNRSLTAKCQKAGPSRCL